MTESCVSVRRKEVKSHKDYMAQIINEENGWDHNVEGDAVEGTVVCASREEVLQALNEVKRGKALDLQKYHWSWLLLVGVGIQVMAEISQKVLDGFGMPAEWAIGIMVPIFKGMDDIGKCSCYGAVKHLEHGMKVVEKRLENGGEFLGSSLDIFRKKLVYLFKAMKLKEM